jgi:hypothetical protein
VTVTVIPTAAAREWWSLPGAPPLHATKRDPERASEGPRVGLVARALGTPLLPWQQYAADVAGELNPDGSYRYHTVVITVPRQSGKTTLMRAVGTDRALSTPGLDVFYTAQTGKDARERWADLVKAIKAGPLARFSTIRQAAGAERVVFANGSMFRAFAPVPNSLHGYTPPLVMLDEAFAHTEQAGDDLMGAIVPAQQTLRRRQLWIVSTAGTAESVFLRRWVEAGRRGDEGVAILEWAAGPEILDIYDPTCWPTFHPGMVPVGEDGRLLASTEAIAEAAASLSRAEFERAYGNRWTRTRSHLIPSEVWERLGNDGQAPPTGNPDSVVYAYDVMHDRSAAAIVAAWRDTDGRLQCRMVRSGPGMEWVAPTVRELRGLGWVKFAAAENGPAREVTDELTRDGTLQVRRLVEREYADAWGFLMQHLAARSMSHDGSDALAVAAANVATRPMADASAPSRRNSSGDVTPLIGLMVAAWELDHRIVDGDLTVRFASGAA